MAQRTLINSFYELIVFVGGHQADVGGRLQQARRPLADQPGQEAANDLPRQLLARSHALPHRRVIRRRLATSTFLNCWKITNE